MTRPNTGQPKTDDELTNATQRANKKMNEEETPEDIKNHPLTKDSLKDDECDEEDDEKLEELREFKKNNSDLYEDNGKGGKQIAVNDDKEMKVEDFDGETITFTQDEWENDRSTRTRIWRRLERNGGVYVKVAHWFNDSDVNKVKTGSGFMAEITNSTEKAYQFEVSPNNENHNAETETVWVPKKAARVHRLQN